MNDPMLIIIIILIGMLFFKEVMAKWFKQFFNIKDNNTQENEEAPQWAQDLQNHYNEHTTAQLENLKNNLNENLKIARIASKDHKSLNKKLDEINDCLRRIERDGVYIKDKK